MAKPLLLTIPSNSCSRSPCLTHTQLPKNNRPQSLEGDLISPITYTFPLQNTGKLQAERSCPKSNT